MNFETWLEALAVELGRRFAVDGEQYIESTGVGCWREMFDDGLSPSDAVDEEVYAAASLQ